jgi:hypothetical protein
MRERVRKLVNKNRWDAVYSLDLRNSQRGADHHNPSVVVLAMGPVANNASLGSLKFITNQSTHLISAQTI